MKSRIWFSRISSSTRSLRVGSVIATHHTHGLDGERMDRAVVEARLDRLLDEPVLLDARKALELGGADRRAQVILGAGLIDDLDLRARQRGLDHQADLVGRDRHRSGCGLGRLGGLDQLFRATELDAWATVRL